MSVSLSEHLPLLAEAPDGIKKLRGLILELAVRGKLVPQDSNDEAASELLKRIAAEKTRLVADGKTRRHKALPDIKPDEVAYELPQGWVWVRNGTLFGLKKGKVPKDLSDEIKEFPYLDIEALDRGNFRRYTGDTKSPRATDKDILVVCDGSRSGLVLDGRNGAIGSTLAVVETPFFIQPLVKLIFKQSYERLNSTMKGAAIPHLDTANLLLEVTGLPPLAEQHRIVAKVDELMALCARMEAEQADAEAAHATLVQTLLGTLTQSRDAADLAANWQRLSQHFDTLFTTEASLDALKQTILQLAVMGKLVPQDPSDEPASELLRRIAAEKARLVAEGKIRKDKSLPPVGEEEKPFELPVGWAWVRLADLLPAFQNGVSSRGDAGGEQVIVLRLADIKDGAVSLADTRQLTIERSAISKYQLEEGDILIVRVNGSADIVGRFVVVEDVSKAIYCDHFIRLRISKDCVIPRFLSLVAASKLVRDKIGDLFITTAGQKTVNQGHIGSLPIPLVSTAEQHRIVAKVDELMALCDSLKADLAESRARQARLATTLIESALQAA